jgi:hypothetical protein
VPNGAFRWEGPERDAKLLGARRLGDVGVGSSIVGALNGGWVTVERAHNDPRARRHETERGDGVKALVKRHLDLEYDEIRMAPLHQFDGRRLAVRLRDLPWPERDLQELAHHSAPLASGVDRHDTYVFWLGFGYGADLEVLGARATVGGKATTFSRGLVRPTALDSHIGIQSVGCATGLSGSTVIAGRHPANTPDFNMAGCRQSPAFSPPAPLETTARDAGSRADEHLR